MTPCEQQKCFPWMIGPCAAVKTHYAGASCNQAARVMMMWLCSSEGLNFEPGDTVCVEHRMFTPMKCLLLTSRNLPQPPPFPDPSLRCLCFPKTALMPKGCTHKKVNIMALDSSYARTYCEDCSVCIRCKGLLGSSELFHWECKLALGCTALCSPAEAVQALVARWQHIPQVQVPGNRSLGLLGALKAPCQ